MNQYLTHKLRGDGSNLIRSLDRLCLQRIGWTHDSCWKRGNNWCRNWLFFTLWGNSFCCDLSILAWDSLLRVCLVWINFDGMLLQHFFRQSFWEQFSLWTRQLQWCHWVIRPHVLVMWGLLIGPLPIDPSKLRLRVAALILFHLLELLFDRLDSLRLFAFRARGVLDCATILWFTRHAPTLVFLANLKLIYILLGWVARKNVDDVCLLGLDLESLLNLHMWCWLGEGTEVLDLLDVLSCKTWLNLEVLLDLSDWLRLRMSFLSLYYPCFTSNLSSYFLAIAILG